MIPDVDISMGAVHVWERNRDVVLRLWRSEAIGIAIEPWVVIVALGLGLGRFVALRNGQPYVAFLMPGLIAMFPMFAAVFECAWGSYVRLEMQGTFRAIIATPVSVDDVITGEILWGATRAAISATYILLVAFILTPWLHMVRSPWALAIVPVSIVPGLLFSALALCFVSIARAMSQFSYFFNLIVNPMFWFGGAFFPIEQLPKWAQTLANVVPLTHAVRLYRGLLQGELRVSLLFDLGSLVLLAGCCYWLALLGMRRRLIH